MSVDVKRNLLSRYRFWKSELRIVLQAATFMGRVLTARKVKVVIGASGLFGDGWIPSEREYLNLLDESHWRRTFWWRKIDAMLAEHVLEHLAVADVRKAMQICHRYMRIGARFRIAVPDGFSPDSEYIQMVRPGGDGEGSDDHKVLFDIESLESLLIDTGFAVARLEYFDANGVFHETDWDRRDGYISRCMRDDPRNQDGQIKYTSLIVDALKV